MRKIIKQATEPINSSYSTPDFLDKNHLPSLDGWRAMAVLIVILGHFRLTLTEGNLVREFLKITIFAELGVKMFFVLSGFLITTLLIKEKLIYGKINILNFFIRRFLRIFPVLYLYLAVVYVVNYAFDLNLIPDHFIAPLLYINNFNFFNKTWLTGHTWSLAVEEQFYLIWPFFFKFSKSKILICASILILIPLLKVICYLFPALSNTLLIPFLMPAGSIFTGCFLSLIVFKKKTESFKSIYRNFKEPYLLILILILYIIHYCTTKGLLGRFILPFGDLTTDFCISFLLLFSIIKEESLFFRILNSTFFKKIGLISYSLYIWQQLFIINMGEYPSYETHLFFPVNLTLTFLVAFLSYYLFEKPILKFKRNFSAH